MSYDETFFSATVAFLHIPKCAGQSVLEAFSQLYPPQSVHRYYPPDDISRRTATPPSLIVGHFNYGYQFTLSSSVRCATVLRHPIDRLISHIKFDRDVFYSDYGKRFPDIARIFEEEKSASKIIEATRLWYYDNCMVRILSGIGSTVPYGEISNIHLEYAKNNLMAMELVGFQDSLESFATNLRKSFNYAYFNIPKVNMAETRDLGSSIIEFDERYLADLSPYDIQLWYWARTAFLDRHH